MSLAEAFKTEFDILVDIWGIWKDWLRLFLRLSKDVWYMILILLQSLNAWKPLLEKQCPL